MLGYRIRIHVKAIIVNMISKNMIDSLEINGIKIILIYMIVARKVIYNLFYQEEASISNEVVSRELYDKIHLIHVYRKKN